MSSLSLNQIDRHISNRLRVIRKTAGMSQTLLGEHLNCTFQQIQKYETAANRIAPSRLFIAAELFGVTISYFFEGLTADPEIDDLRAQISEIVAIADPAKLAAISTLVK
jgi:transcriptional regulator with XRE-family HTH domain